MDQYCLIIGRNSLYLQLIFTACITKGRHFYEVQITYFKIYPVSPQFQMIIILPKTLSGKFRVECK